MRMVRGEAASCDDGRKGKEHTFIVARVRLEVEGGRGEFACWRSVSHPVRRWGG